MNIPLLAALPMPRENYEKDFAPSAKERLDFHCGRADEVFVVPWTEPAPDGGADRNFLFRQAGIYVVSHCHILIALWDGGPGTEAACGTAEAVDFVLNGSYYPSLGMSIRTANNTGVIHIYTPRGEREEEKAGTIHYLGNQEAVNGILRITNEFNREAPEAERPAKSRLPEPGPYDRKLERMECIGLIAGTLSSLNAKHYRMVLALLVPFTS